jgi:hypothetical protein
MDFRLLKSTRSMNEIKSNPHVGPAGTDGTPGPNKEQVANLPYLIGYIVQKNTRLESGR